MRFTNALATIGIALSASLAHAVDCTAPDAPAVPAGKHASQKEMLEAQRRVKDYVAEAEQYIACLKAEEQALGEDASKEQRLKIVGLYNEMVDEMKATSDEFNTSVQAFQTASTQ